jgi:ParB-like chromosome segregation protein Spo0J
MAELEAREAAAHARAEALRARIADLTEQLTAEEDLLSRLGITRQTVMEILGGGDEHRPGALEGADGGPGGVEQDGDAGVRAALRVDGPIARAGLEGARAAVGVGAVRVPEWRAGVEEAVLPVAYRDVLEVLADAGQPLRAKQIAAALGLGDQPRSVEGLRLKLKRLVRRGWLAEPAAGLFARRPQPAESA